MQQKINSSVGSGAQANYSKESSLFNKYLALQIENQKLKRRIREIGTESYERLEQALQYQAERDDCQEKARERRNHE